jgi:hypothetical protein
MDSTVRDTHSPRLERGALNVVGRSAAPSGRTEVSLNALLTALYAATVFLSAFLLFQVQPLVAKIILPWFGGSASVWRAALLFFQTLLLGGYAYAHGSIRLLPPRAGAVLHTALLVVSCAFLPILPSPALKLDGAGDPTIRILVLLAVTVGLPYFMLSSTSPMLQAWYGRRKVRGNPYRLFALSNAGSLLALLSFPVFVEPNLTSHVQAYVWSSAYAVFVIFCGVAAWAGWPPHDPERIAAAQIDARSTVHVRELVLWTCLAALPSTLLLAATEHLTQNVAPIPLLWVLPLSAYLLTFALAFESDRIYQRAVVLPMLPIALGAMAYLIYGNMGNISLQVQVPVFLAGLFVCCLACHGELARRRPATAQLTLYYFMVALGGATGGVFVAVVAPHMFRSYAELPIALVACALVVAVVLWSGRFATVRPAIGRFLLTTSLLVFAASLIRQEMMLAADARLRVRNFYGALRVVDDGGERDLYHGTIRHGGQLLADTPGRRATTYYGPNSGIGRALRALEADRAVKVGIAGLGAGVLMSYSRPGDVYRIYEINPLVAQIAQHEFTFYSASPVDKQIFLGDARLVLERQPDQHFDLLAVDAFSGDAVPMHLLTREAFALYLRHLKLDGVLAIHVTNRYLNLVPVIAANAQRFGRRAAVFYDDGHDAAYLTYSTWVLVTADDRWFRARSFVTADSAPAQAPGGFHAWSDDYSNLYEVLKLDKPQLVEVKLWRVEPGASLGPIRLRASIGDAIALLGPATGTERLRDGTILYRWFDSPKNTGVGIRTDRSGVVEAVWTLGDRRYLTPEGLHVGRPQSAIESAMGKPSRVTISRASAIQTLWYDSQGIWFGIDKLRTVYAIGVTTPK